MPKPGYKQSPEHQAARMQSEVLTMVTGMTAEERRQQQKTGAPTPRWTTLRRHEVQQAYWHSPHRFNTIPAGRRSGKTELGKRKLVKHGLGVHKTWPARFFAAGPTRDQAKRIFWDDLKALSPKRFLAQRPSESELMIEYITGNQIWVVGLDKPERIEGQPWDGGVVTEIGNTKPTAWPMNIRPALSDRLGWCDLEGVPEGRNHYYDLDRAAKAEMKDKGDASDWGSFSWPSSDILPPAEIEAAMRDLDEMTFNQEYRASFVNFEGRAYYPFTEERHCSPLVYDPKLPLILCFDFNVEPGVCAIIQEQRLPGEYRRNKEGVQLLDKPIIGTGIIGEVHIPRNSNTPAVCKKIIADWGKHGGAVRCYGDATGGARGSAQTEGSDWDLIVKELRPTFKDKLDFRVKQTNPRERSRLNAVNSRLLSMSQEVHLLVDGKKAPHVVKDFEGVPLLKGGSGEIDKKKAPLLSHISDAIGYYIEYEYPVVDATIQHVTISGV